MGVGMAEFNDGGSLSSILFLKSYQIEKEWLPLSLLLVRLLVSSGEQTAWWC